MHYEVITVCESGPSPIMPAVEKLEKKVNKAIKEGYRPAGGFSTVATVNSGMWTISLLQPMVKG